MLRALFWYAIETISGALPELSALPVRTRPCPCSWKLPLQIPLEVLPYAYPPTFVTKKSGQIPSLPWLKDLNLIRISITHFSLEEINTDFPHPLTSCERNKERCTLSLQTAHSQQKFAAAFQLHLLPWIVHISVTSQKIRKTIRNLLHEGQKNIPCSGRWPTHPTVFIIKIKI